eukprot:TRINITY_DN47025_c0_g1_i2.p4 TRINITY_DN47025_c0_g1~~TRINITY_DN47025_c0_g1_i2.p4  ORF type:complete len:109 (-),score=18.87 TRINITY_DN47025_c0_g1_i2:38-364(-)
MDMILTGRAVDAAEALHMGLANRLCAPGKALESAIQLATEISEFPQICMRSDRRSAYEGMGMGFLDAMNNEFRAGQEAMLKESRVGAASFVKGKGRHGQFGYATPSKL